MSRISGLGWAVTKQPENLSNRATVHPGREAAMPGKMLKVSGHVFSFTEFIAANDLSFDDLYELDALEVGSAVVCSGGAAQEFTVERVA